MNRSGEQAAADPFRLSGARPVCTLPAALLLLISVCGCTSEETSPSPASSDGESRSTATRATSLAPEESPIRLVARRSGTGLTAVHFSGISEDRWYPVLNGSGLAATDIDRDGRPDVILPTACPLPVPRRSEGHETRMFRNRGDWTFADVSRIAGGQFDGFVAGIAVADFDNDGFADYFLSCVGSGRLYRNQGDGTFALVPAGDLSMPHGFCTGSAFADLDRDGNPDLYLCRYGEWSTENNPWCGDRETGERAFCEPPAITPAVDLVFRSRGDGTFEDVTAGSGIDAAVYRSQGVVAADFNGDSRVDLYVANDGQPNCLFLNDGEFQFRDTAQVTGGAYSHSGAVQGSMGLAVGDVDRDGTPELFVTNYAGEHNTLYQSLGNCMLMDKSRAGGVVSGSVGLVGWGTAFCDLDSDRWNDLVLVNGHIDPRTHLLGGTSQYKQPTLVYHNHEGHLRLLETCIRDEGESLGSSRGLAVADLDGDGDVDLLFSNQDAPPGVLENRSLRRRPAATLRLVGTRGNRDALGAEIRADTRRPWRWPLVGGGSYLSSSPTDCVIPLREGSEVPIEIVWPDGERTVVPRVRPGDTLAIREMPEDAAGCRGYLIPE